jgi:hypothetical protein
MEECLAGKPRVRIVAQGIRDRAGGRPLKTDDFESEPPFGPYDEVLDACDEFTRPNPYKITTIRSPRAVLRQYRAAFPSRGDVFRGIPVELAADQSKVSVRGISSGHNFEYPEPE